VLYDVQYSYRPLSGIAMVSMLGAATPGVKIIEMESLWDTVDIRGRKLPKMG